ncbi:aegerolysin family protein [Emticicia sp. 17c]|uniref:aegerolysin family protein n=1 Tax=Emticicia sp. 17c TaxID=3127704 RepID=UPI00301BA549
MSKPSFIARASIGIKQVLAVYPDALLLEVDAWKTEGTTLNPDDLDKMRIVFAYKNIFSITIENISFDTFAQPVLHKEPFSEDIVITKWPLKMDLPQALELVQKANLEQQFSNVTLRHPLSQHRTHTLYIIGTSPMQPYITVDTVTMEVKKMQQMLGEQWFSVNICVYGVSIKGTTNVVHGSSSIPKTVDFPDGKCTATSKFTSASWSVAVGTEGTIELKENITNGQVICKIHWDSPSVGENKFYLTDQNSGYSCEITGSGNAGQSTGTLGACSMNISKL